MNEHIAKTQRAYLDLVEHLVPTSDELNDWLPTLRDVAPAHLEELRALGPRANWSAEPYALVFRHYVTERRRVLLEDYMAEHLSAADFAEWVDFFSGDMLDGMTRKT
ncbi:hypothetical protein [Hymenobacter arizonensis]|uniref:Uncharacterized protein n=1 Tax=Hymenobacter arizonensis TaxID=1227077 RepID=A0A1I6BT87_HYMAR|nr:hypothetical protein [Hymenobacter arizonensis]SFQ84168.1 hypothetical protein SAMN04515668_5080 [Hymenobacter arizonensis]